MKKYTFKELYDLTGIDLSQHLWDMTGLNYTASCQADKEEIRKILNLQNKQKLFFTSTGIIITRGYILREVNWNV